MGASSFNDALAITQALQYVATGRYFKARELAELHLQSNKNDLRAIRILGVAAFHFSQYDKAEMYLKRCVSRAPKDSTLRCDLAQVYSIQGRDGKAIDAYDVALKLDPGNIRARAGKAEVLERAGNVDAARQTLADELVKGTNDDGLGIVLIRLFVREKRHDEAIALADKLLAQPPADLQSRRLLFLEIGRLHDKLGNHDRAFAAFTDANHVYEVKFNPQSFEERFDNLISVFSASNLQMLPRARNQSELPVFIACMPRSGSTLVEQIIHAHPKAFGAGEIDDLNDMVRHLPTHLDSPQLYPACLGDVSPDKLDRLADMYLSALKRYDRSAQRVANKHLLNYQHLGMVELLFPNARIIHIQRDRLDNGLACFMAALAPAQAQWVTDLEHIGFAWRQYERLMAHWRQVLTVPMLDVKYEDLVEDTETWIRRIIDFIGLPWDDRCLRYWEADRKVMTLSYDQVRKPIFKTAVKRWERYEAFLGPLKDALAGGSAP